MGSGTVPSIKLPVNLGRLFFLFFIFITLEKKHVSRFEYKKATALKGFNTPRILSGRYLRNREKIYIDVRINKVLMEYKARTTSKALSPLVATILLVAFALGVGSFVGDWISKYAKENIERADTSAQSVVDCSRQMIDIISVEHPSESEIRVKIGNYGQIPVLLKSVVAYNRTDMHPCELFKNSSGMLIERGAEITLVNTSCPTGYGDVYIVRATTACQSVFDEWINRT